MRNKIYRYLDSINKSISKKLFFITMVIFILFLSFTLIVQRIFFENMYFNKKSQEIKSVTAKFIQKYNKSESYDEILELMKECEEEYNTYIGIVEYKPGFSIAMNIEVVDERNSRSKHIMEIVNEIRNNKSLMQKLVSNNIAVFSVESDYSENKELVCVTLDESNLIVATTSMLPISEGISVIEEFYKYFYVVAIFIILILSYVYSNMITNPLKNINDKAKKMSTLDFTERCEYESEDEIGNLATTLNFLSYNLTSALTSLQQTNVRLQKEIEKERQLEKIRKDFVAAASHELKTPITIIQGYAEGIKDGIFSEEDQKESLDIIIDETNRMSNLVKDMLELSALESKVIDLNFEEFNLGEMISSNLRALSNEINEKNIKVIERYCLNPIICADKFRMEQVVINFITNAIRYTKNHGNIFIAIENDGDFIRISFENTCDLLSDEQLENIWHKFYKVDKSRTRKLGGNGLGLSIVKNILNMHNFKYGAKNTERGVEFYFYCSLVK
ncbi:MULTISPECIES: HAMP domain-containing sensor histidine kinase [Clostridium]|uniref:histidine kinase n=1 Tax=Clostridium senegalense TaxID=1465809 RepID=A0A6M0H6P7_9CLOT|nr:MULTISPECIES: HAMP domain-containing sensor histidine kinase [Clostridium]NEU06197.1 HAMP domain-containing protein [Clostridium senegalense]